MLCLVNTYCVVQHRHYLSDHLHCCMGVGVSWGSMNTTTHIIGPICWRKACIIMPLSNAWWSMREEGEGWWPLVLTVGMGVNGSGDCLSCWVLVLGKGVRLLVGLSGGGGGGKSGVGTWTGLRNDWEFAVCCLEIAQGFTRNMQNTNLLYTVI